VILLKNQLFFHPNKKIKHFKCDIYTFNPKNLQKEGLNKKKSLKMVDKKYKTLTNTFLYTEIIWINDEICSLSIFKGKDYSVLGELEEEVFD
jgi:hypothetical protein